MVKRLTDIVDEGRYPLEHAHWSNELQLTVERCRQQLAEELVCTLPNFLTPAALQTMLAEAMDLLPHAHHNHALRNCYLSQERTPDHADNHPLNVQDRSSVRMIAYDQLGATSMLRCLYESDAFRWLVASIVNRGELFPNNDPYQPANYVCYEAGDESAWHFDSNNAFTITLMIQAGDSGGEFELSPNTRSPTDERYDQVSAVLRGENATAIKQLSRTPGELCLFAGCHSLHRVTPVTGDTQRVMAVFVYEFKPGCIGDPAVNATVYGPRTAIK